VKRQSPPLSTVERANQLVSTRATGRATGQGSASLQYCDCRVCPSAREARPEPSAQPEQSSRRTRTSKTARVNSDLS
jgi:hypothetical protein